MPYARDPVSVSFDAAARRLLARAYGSPGQWVSAWLPDPTLRQRTRWAETGVTNLTGPDDPSTASRSGGLDARSRWGRAFVRALCYQHRWYSPGRGGTFRSARRTAPREMSALRIEVGRHVAASPQFDPREPGRGGLPPRRRVRVQLAAGGQAKERAVRRLPQRDRTFTDSGAPGPRWSDPALRDWA